MTNGNDEVRRQALTTEAGFRMYVVDSMENATQINKELKEIALSHMRRLDNLEMWKLQCETKIKDARMFAVMVASVTGFISGVCGTVWVWLKNH